MNRFGWDLAVQLIDDISPGLDQPDPVIELQQQGCKVRANATATHDDDKHLKPPLQGV